LLVFPQLRSGAVTQLPLRRTESYRTPRNALSDGSTVAMTDGGFAQAAWNLKYSGLSANEAQALQDLFAAAMGRLNPFVFVDPTANLLLWSEDFSQAAWQKDPNISLTQVTDAFGGSAGVQLANNGGAAQGVQQTTNAPGSLQFCFSVYLRSAAPAEVNLTIGGTVAATAMTGSMWRRFSAVANGGAASQTEFGLSIPAATTIQVCGMQAEAQPSAGDYKSTTGSGGVYPNSRFDQDALDVVTTGPGVFDCSFRIVSQL